MQHHPVVIIGAGIAGLTCATYLYRKTVPFILIESSEQVGGRVKTDRINGFQLDRGFQVFLTSYPEAKKVLDYEELRLQAFRSGAIVRQNNKSFQLVNPLKEPLAAVSDLFSPVGTLADKIRILRFAAGLSSKKDEDIFNQTAVSTYDYLKKYGWSEQIIDNFFKPFFGGVFLERELITSSNFFEFVFKQFAVSDATLPMKGIQAIPEQLAAKLPVEVIRKGITVKGLENNKIYLSNGEVLVADFIVLAADATPAAQLQGKDQHIPFNNTSCMYFEAPLSPLQTPMLVINSDRNNLINNFCVPSDIASAYAPAGKSLISVSIIKQHTYSDEQLNEKVINELTQWFGSQVNEWNHLKTYHIPQALPSFRPGDNAAKNLKISESMFRCGDYTAYPSLNAAMQTGREVASMVAERVGGL